MIEDIFTNIKTVIDDMYIDTCTSQEHLANFAEMYGLGVALIIHIENKTYCLENKDCLKIYDKLLDLRDIIIRALQRIDGSSQINGQENILNHCKETLSPDDYMKIEQMMFQII